MPATKSWRSYWLEAEDVTKAIADLHEKLSAVRERRLKR